MSPRIKTLWVTALRHYSGSVAKYGMRHHNAYDPLGILCDLATKELSGLRWEPCPSNSGYYIIDCHMSDLPDRVVSWANLGNKSPKLTHKGIITPIHRLSDMGITFNQLADLIEEQYCWD